MLSWPVSSVCSAQASASGKLRCWGERGGDGRMVGVPHLPPQCQVPISVRSGQHQIYPPALHPKIYRWVRLHLNLLSLFYMYSLPLSVKHSSSLSSFNLSQNWKLISSLLFCILICHFCCQCANLSPVMHALHVFVCVCERERERVCVGGGGGRRGRGECVCDEMSIWCHILMSL